MRRSRQGRHKNIVIDDELPDWVATTDNACLQSIAEDAYTAKAWADKYRASEKLSCADVYHAGMKALAKMGNESLPAKDRCTAGNRAARKFWEAKVCARRRR